MRGFNLIAFMAALASGPAIGGSLLLISIDGLPPGYVTEASRHRLTIPNLQRFLEQGAYARGVLGVVPTVTYPSHTTLMTGMPPAIHGIVSNTPFDPLNTNREGWYWYAEDIRVPTLWQAASRAGLKTSSVNWPVTVGEKHIDVLLPEFWRASNADDLKLMRTLARPVGRLEQLEAKLGPFIDGNIDTLESDRIRTRFALAILREDKPRFMAVHLIALDGTQHREGPMTPAAYAVLEALDGMIGELAAAAHANDPAATVAIVSDHGFIATHTAVNLRVRFVEAGLITLASPTSDGPAQVTTWEAQVWPAGASAAVVLKDPNDAEARKRVRELLARLAADARNGIARIQEAEDLGSAGAFPGASFGVEFAPGYYLGGALRGEPRAPSTSKGTHGYLPQRPEMHASFFIKGPGIAARRDLGVVDMRRVAPTLAGVLSVKLSSATEPPLPVQAEIHVRR